MKNMTIALCSALTAFAAELPASDEVVTRMLEQENARQSLMSGYSVTCRYSLQNKSRKAEMLVQWTRLANGVKKCEIVSEQGDGGVRSHVFHKLLEAEVEASLPAQRDRSRITPANYWFEVVGRKVINGREAYVLNLEPKTDSRYLTRGRVWVDATDYAVIRISGNPAGKVSFWTRKVEFVQSFQKNGDFWLAATNHSLTDAKVFGLADLVIEYFDYRIATVSARVN